MKSYENVIVTVRLTPGGKSLDMELPSFIPIEELGQRILETLRVLNPTSYLSIEGLRFWDHGREITGTDTLASAGLWDGSILDITTHKEV